MRTTEDHTTKAESDYAYEIMWEYHNPESSTPYSEKRVVKDIPAGTKIWAHECNCQAAINKMQKQKTKS